MPVTIDKEKLVEGLKDAFDVGEFKDKFEDLKGFKFNPFNFGPDGKPEGWDIFIRDGKLASEVFLQVIRTVERLCFEAGQVASGADKLEAVAEFLDEIIQLPFYLEWADRPVIKMVITFLVNQLNALFGKDWINKIPIPV
jgi:hypothetical protein